jgi:hypothetical protein
LESPEFDPSYVVPEKVLDEADQEIAIELSDAELLAWEEEQRQSQPDDDDDDEEETPTATKALPTSSAAALNGDNGTACCCLGIDSSTGTCKSSHHLLFAQVETRSMQRMIGRMEWTTRMFLSTICATS